jgi:hypothetical protein
MYYVVRRVLWKTSYCNHIRWTIEITAPFTLWAFVTMYMPHGNSIVPLTYKIANIFGSPFRLPSTLDTHRPSKRPSVPREKKSRSNGTHPDSNWQESLAKPLTHCRFLDRIHIRTSPTPHQIPSCHTCYSPRNCRTSQRRLLLGRSEEPILPSSSTCPASSLTFLPSRLQWPPTPSTNQRPSLPTAAPHRTLRLCAPVIPCRLIESTALSSLMPSCPSAPIPTRAVPTAKGSSAGSTSLIKHP